MESKSKDSPDRLRMESDFVGEFGEMRRSNIIASGNTIITDSKKQDPLKAIKLIPPTKGKEDNPIIYLSSSESEPEPSQQTKQPNLEPQVSREEVPSSSSTIPLVRNSIPDLQEIPLSKIPLLNTSSKKTKSASHALMDNIPLKLPKLIKIEDSPSEFPQVNTQPTSIQTNTKVLQASHSIPLISGSRLPASPWGTTHEKQGSMKFSVPLIPASRTLTREDSNEQKDDADYDEDDDEEVTPEPTSSLKRSRGRPRKQPSTSPPTQLPANPPTQPRKRGRPPKSTTPDQPIVKRKRGRPPKSQSPAIVETPVQETVRKATPILIPLITKRDTSNTPSDASMADQSTVYPLMADKSMTDARASPEADVSEIEDSDKESVDQFFDAVQSQEDGLREAQVTEPQRPHRGRGRPPKNPKSVDSIIIGTSGTKSTKSAKPPKASKQSIKPTRPSKVDRPEDTVTLSNKGRPTNGTRDSTTPAPEDVGIVVNTTQIQTLKRKLLTKLMNRDSDLEPYGLDDKIVEFEKLLTSAIKNGESSSCVVFGPHNSGKTCAFQSALKRVRSGLKDDEDFMYININGLAQDDDKFAVRAIAEQLDREISRIYKFSLKDLEAKELLSRKSITNTFSNVLKVLDDEISLGDSSMAKIRYPIVFSIDEVDVFANQSRQTLLYNLFDLAENSSVPVCVVCFTSKFTFKELLEKRVRSRFSQRTINFRRFSQEKFIEVCRKSLSVDNPENEYEEEWNRDIAELISENTAIRQAIIYNHLSQGNIREFQNRCIYPVSKLSLEQPRLVVKLFSTYAQNQSRASYVRTINTLSDLEMFLLVSAARVIAKTDMSWVNLNIVYEEYTAQVKAQQREVTSSTGFGAVATTGFKVWSKESCKHPWETLRDMGLLTLPGSGMNRSEFSNSSFETRMWQVELTLDELRRIVHTHKPVKPWTRL